MADLYLFRSTDRNAETVTNDKSGKTLPPELVRTMDLFENHRLQRRDPPDR